MKKIIAALLFSAVTLSLCSCDRVEKFTKRDVTLFDTETVITGYEVSEEAFEKTAGDVLDCLTEYHRLCDIYNEYQGLNNLKTVNDNAGKKPVEVDKKLIDVIEFGKEMYALTQGKTNIAIGSVTSIWHRFREEGKSLPPIWLLEKASEHTDIEKVICDRDACTVFLEDGEMSLDVGAIAKGYATEAAAKMLFEEKKTGFALSVGGNIRTVGTKGDGTPWITGIENPMDNADEAIIEKVELESSAAVTSGSYQRYYEVEGKRYHHIIDPETLMPKDDYLSVTVIYEDSGVSDALSTALFNMAEEDGRAILDSLGADGVWVYPDGRVSKTY